MNAQAFAALQRSQEVRIARAAWRTQLRRMPERDGRAVVAQAVISPDDFLATLPVFTAVSWIKNLGQRRTQRLLDQAGITPARTFTPLGKLTNNERVNLARAIQPNDPNGSD